MPTAILGFGFKFNSTVQEHMDAQDYRRYILLLFIHRVIRRIALTSQSHVIFTGRYSYYHSTTAVYVMYCTGFYRVFFF